MQAESLHHWMQAECPRYLQAGSLHDWSRAECPCYLQAESLHDSFQAECLSYGGVQARSRRALAMTQTELKLMATPAIMGLRRRPNQG